MVKLEHLFLIPLDAQIRQHGGAGWNNDTQIVRRSTPTNASLIIQVSGGWLVTRNEEQVGLIRVPDNDWTIVYDLAAKFYIAYLVKTDHGSPYIAEKSVLGESLLEAQAAVNLIKGNEGVSRFFDDAGSYA